MGKIFLIGSETIGRGDDDLGFEIFMTMAKSLVGRDDRPRAIVFWNTAVKLLAVDSPAVPCLKALEAKGVQMLAGQLCVRELELTDKLAVGKSVTMDEILNLLLQHEVVSL